MKIYHERIPYFTLAGAASGAASTGLGAAMLRPADPDRFQPGPSALAGFVGGALTHAALGTLAAFARNNSLRSELYAVGQSAVLGALTSGLVGGALLGATGHLHARPGDLVAEGALGGVVLGIAGGVVAVALACCGIGLWAAREAHDGAERLLAHGEGEPPVAHDPAHEP